MGGRNDVTVRHATDHDVDALGQIWKELMAMHEASDERFALASSPVCRWREMAREMLAREDGFLLTAERGGELVGFCLGWVAHNPPIYRVGEVGFISEIAVRREAQRQGVGTALVAGAEEWFEEKGLDEYQLSTAVWNDGARRFWDRLGGEELLVRYRFDLRRAKARDG